MQNENEIRDELKKFVSFKNIRIVAICGLLGCMIGVTLATYYIKYTPLLFLGSGVFKTSMVSIGHKDYFPTEDASNLILFAERSLQNDVHCGPFIYKNNGNGSITAAVVDKKMSVIRVDGSSTDPQILKICISSFIEELKSYDQRTTLNYKKLERPLRPNNAHLIGEDLQVNLTEGHIVGQINAAKNPTKHYPIDLYKLIFLFSLGGIFIGVIICYFKTTFLNPV